ncbi:MAG: VPLPA-CTERM sorting domain-containing protein [Methylococcales bacterium]|nr:VPLPA-CTERM sorting domain-containing protein [Methylococcales bacterium]
MFHSLTISISTAVSLFLMTSSLHAAVMTFDSLTANGGIPSIYTENGITASGTASIFVTPGEAHLDDFGTPFLDHMDFTMDSLFSAISFDVNELNGGNFFSDLGTAEGFLNGALIASFDFSSATSIINLPSSFIGLDTLRITATSHFELNSSTDCAPCNHFGIDNITLMTPSPVPLPAAFPLMISALAGLGLFRYKRNDTL